MLMNIFLPCANRVRSCCEVVAAAAIRLGLNVFFTHSSMVDGSSLLAPNDEHHIRTCQGTCASDEQGVGGLQKQGH